MVASVDIHPLLDVIDASTPASPHTRCDLVLSSIALPPYLVIGVVTLLPLGFYKHSCCQVLAFNGLLCRPLHLLSHSPHHMLGYGDLDFLSRSPHSPPDGPPPLRLSSPNWRWWALVGVQMHS